MKCILPVHYDERIQCIVDGGGNNVIAFYPNYKDNEIGEKLAELINERSIDIYDGPQFPSDMKCTKVEIIPGGIKKQST